MIRTFILVLLAIVFAQPVVHAVSLNEKSAEANSDASIVNVEIQKDLLTMYPQVFAEFNAVVSASYLPEIDYVQVVTRNFSGTGGSAAANTDVQGFKLILKDGLLSIEGADSLGALYGSLEVIDRINNKSGFSDGLYFQDAPDHKNRALHFVLRKLTLKKAKGLVVKARNARFNQIVVGLADMVAFDAMKGVVRSSAFSKAEVKELVLYARQNGLELIPEVKLLSHQEKFLKDKYPELMFNELTYDPRNPEVFTLVFSVLDEIIDLFDPSAIHIGHDEVIGWHQKLMWKKLGPDAKQLPPELFALNIKKIHSYLADHGVKTWIWGDMLLDPEFGRGPDRIYFHGRNGYEKLVDQIPRDIIICDWHYENPMKEFPSVDYFERFGFRIYGVTWKDSNTTGNFSRYLLNNNNRMGMMATTWFHVQRGEWDIVNGIITGSGGIFWNGE